MNIKKEFELFSSVLCLIIFVFSFFYILQSTNYQDPFSIFCAVLISLGVSLSCYGILIIFSDMCENIYKFIKSMLTVDKDKPHPL